MSQKKRKFTLTSLVDFIYLFIKYAILLLNIYMFSESIKIPLIRNLSRY